MADEVKVRKALKEDMPAVMEMIQELAEYEGYPDGPKITFEDLQRDAYESNHQFFFSLVAECTKTKTIVGHVMCNFAYSSWSGRAMYLEDFYVKPEMRGKKVGHLLFKEMCKVAKEKGCHRIDWHTQVGNALAIGFYESHGAYDVCKKESRTCYRITWKDILKAAEDN